VGTNDISNTVIHLDQLLVSVSPVKMTTSAIRSTAGLESRPIEISLHAFRVNLVHPQIEKVFRCHLYDTHIRENTLDQGNGAHVSSNRFTTRPKRYLPAWEPDFGPV
jgi:hypothetical protein